ncbi:MAG: hypothetical protein A3H72_01550 [Candidatus Doudnabacteria bacterium RIFCSPLOWO2_02_FULL_48_8]|uniref:Uncharacterized protein n=1 Tax=Candidatus Doudnabacteria bacterium RIFCSPHIGHO2_01_FULL_46_24 TaxID=1817825 RepID=A0A1F5NSY3_9BACT|nr:MAG: hypothetical protein A2720_04445 [Candidatus Doudnabacteria bacterium RIFCSPHIGHO2_01_FULL_46_24]OGE95298.1 MAG: hypothetical protein A3H72_01550 [Candidatus Doudnabacteria bacterium RIFCSPLOWO2_02_FULL_48_8]
MESEESRQKEWEIRTAELKPIVDRTRDLETLGIDAVSEYQVMIAEFGNALLAKYPDAPKFMLWHILAGSSPDPNSPTSDFDTPEGSIEKFIRNKLGGQQGFIIGKLLSLIGLALILMVLLFLSRFAQEGENFYPMRVLGEQIEYSLIPTESGKINYKIEQLDDSAFSSRKSAALDDFDKVRRNSEKFVEERQELQKRAESVPDEKTKQELQAGLNAAVENQICALNDAIAKAPEEERQKLLEILAKSQ